MVQNWCQRSFFRSQFQRSTDWIFLFVYWINNFLCSRLFNGRGLIEGELLFSRWLRIIWILRLFFRGLVVDQFLMSVVGICVCGTLFLNVDCGNPRFAKRQGVGGWRSQILFINVHREWLSSERSLHFVPLLHRCVYLLLLQFLFYFWNVHLRRRREVRDGTVELVLIQGARVGVDIDGLGE